MSTARPSLLSIPYPAWIPPGTLPPPRRRAGGRTRPLDFARMSTRDSRRGPTTDDVSLCDGPPVSECQKDLTLAGRTVSRNRNRAHTLFLASAGRQIDFDSGQDFAQIVNRIVQGLHRNFRWPLLPPPISH